MKWLPITDAYRPIYSTENNGTYVVVAGEDMAMRGDLQIQSDHQDHSLGGVILPDDVRLCRRIEEPEPVIAIESYWVTPEPLVYFGIPDSRGGGMGGGDLQVLNLYHDEAYALYKALELRLSEWDTLYGDTSDATETLPL